MYWSKIATTNQEFDAIAALNYETFVEEIPQHEVNEAGLRDRVKIMVGGAPVNAEYAKEIGADAYTADANEAVVVARQLLGK